MKTILKKIKQEFFQGQTEVQFEENIEGYIINQHGNYVLGCRAGPDIHHVHLLHEMGHFAE